MKGIGLVIVIVIILVIVVVLVKGRVKERRCAMKDQSC